MLVSETREKKREFVSENNRKVHSFRFDACQLYRVSWLFVQ